MQQTKLQEHLNAVPSARWGRGAVPDVAPTPCLSPHYLLNESKERLPVVFPLLLKLGGRWVFAAGQLQGDLKAVGPHVVVVLHPT